MNNSSTPNFFIMLRENFLILLLLLGSSVLLSAQLSVSLSGTSPTCAGFTNGVISTTVSGGNQPYLYLWNNGFSSSTLWSVSAGNYSVTVTDGTGATAASSITLNEPSSVESEVNIDNVCSGNGNATVSVSGGSPPYTYQWDNGQTMVNATGLNPGNHCVTVTDANGCKDIACTTIFAPLTVSVLTTNLLCFTACDASVTASITGGKGPFSFIWNTGATTQILENQPAGFYAVTVTDANGCTVTGDNTVGAPPLLNVSVDIDNPACGSGGTGTATATGTGGVPPYLFHWSNGQNGSTITNLNPGLYTVTVVDAQNCTDITGFAVIEQGNLDLVVSASPTTDCGSEDGTASATASGGTPPYTYTWNNGANTSSISGLAPGNYSVTATDAAGCAAIGTVTVAGAPSIVVQISENDVTCNGTNNGSADVMAFQGTPPYTYLWSNGVTTMVNPGLEPGNYFVTVTDAAGCSATGSANIGQDPAMEIAVTGTSAGCDVGTNGSATVNVIANGTPPYAYSWSNGSTTQTISDLAPGFYSVGVADANGCFATTSVEIEATASFSVSVDATDLSCFGDNNGAAMVIANGGTAPFTYNWSNGATTANISNLPIGTYSVTVTDSGGCSGSGSATVSSPSPLMSTGTGQDVNCFGGNNGSASVSVNGGTPPYDYQWSTGGTTAQINGLVAGTYGITVTDANGCLSITSVSIGQPTQISVSVMTNGATCVGNNSGNASAIVSGGTAPYSYTWSNGSSVSTISNLAPGTYNLTVTDANGCTTTAAATIEQASNPSCNIVITNPISSVGGSDGVAQTQVMGGTAPYLYDWSNGQGGVVADGLSAGSYTVTVTDANGCTTTCNITFVNPAKLGDKIWIDLDRDGCQGASEPGLHDVPVTLTGTDLNGNLFSRFDTTDLMGNYLFDGLPPGSYHITVFPPVGYVFTTQNACGNDATDSDVNTTSGTSQNVSLSSGDCILTLDAGIHLKCENVTNPGIIEGDEILCGPGQDAGPIVEIGSASGGFGNIEYLWMMSTVPGPFNPNNWVPIPGATGPNYDPGVLYETTFFVRCVRRECCTPYLETNIITKEVGFAATAVIEGPNLICVNETVTYAAASAGPGATYSWNFGPWATPQTSNQQIVNVVYNSFGVVNITLDVENNGCMASNFLEVAISDNPTLCGNALVISVESTASNEVMVHWETTRVPGNWEYRIRRSMDGEHFEEIGMVKQASDFHANYEFMDVQPKRGNSFYQVIFENEVGEVFESNVVQVSLFEEKQFLVYPNPFDDQIHIDLKEGISTDVQVAVYSPLGALVKLATLADDQTQLHLNTSELAEGLYYLILNYGEKGEKVFKMVK